jgi:hypothetical protein
MATPSLLQVYPFRLADSSINIASEKEKALTGFSYQGFGAFLPDFALVFVRLYTSRGTNEISDPVGQPTKSPQGFLRGFRVSGLDAEGRHGWHPSGVAWVNILIDKK